MSLSEIRRFRSDALKHRVLIEHIQELEEPAVIEMANAHGYLFNIDESRVYFRDIHKLALNESAMTKTEIFAWQATGNPNALVEERMMEE